MRARYLSDTVATASPGSLLVSLYERLTLDLTRAEAAIGAGDREESASRLLHAQEIVLELWGSLDMTAWSGAADLGRIYSYLFNQLVTANVKRDAELVATCRGLVEPLLDAWRQAALVNPTVGLTSSRVA
jgi:flagellar protein FliS